MKAVIFDVDHTLLNFDEDERVATRKLLAYYGYEVDETLVEELWRLSYEGWVYYDLNDVHTEIIQREYHKRYMDNIDWMFDHFSLPLPKEARQKFNEFLAEAGNPIGNAYAVVEETAKKYDIYFATNGLSFIQRGRVRNFLPFLKGVFVSEEIGTIKPNKVFFEKMLAEIPYSPEEILMVGDSYASDIVGAKSVGIKTCYFNRKGETRDADYCISSLDTLKDIL